MPLPFVVNAMSVVSPIIQGDCDSTRAGIRKLWAIKSAFVEELAIDANTKEVTGIVLAIGETYTRIEFEKDTAALTQTKTVNKSSVNYTQLIEFYEPGLNNDVKNALDDLNCNCSLHVIVEDTNGGRWYCGITYMEDDAFRNLLWETENMQTGEGSGNTGADPTADSAEFFETLVVNTGNYALSVTVDPDEITGYASAWGTDVSAEFWGTDEDATVWGF